MGGGCGRHPDDSSSDDEQQEERGAAATNAGATTTSAQASRPIGLGSWSRATVTIGAAALDAAAAADGGASTATAATAAAPAQQQRQCQKCQQRPAAVVVRQNEPLCAACLEASVVGKVRAATKGRGLLEDGDRVLLALSGGGGASAALLHALLQLRGGGGGGGRPERGKVAFELLVVHVAAPAAAAAAAEAEAAAAVAAAAGVEGAFAVVPLDAAYAADADFAWARLGQLKEEEQAGTSQQQQQQQQQEGQQEEQNGGAAPSRAARLAALMAAVVDATAAEDVAAHLRSQLLVRLAHANGCGKLLLGDCASTVAARVVADAAKGRGFSLPADIQPSDARWAGSGGGDGSSGVVTLLPMREVSMKEARALAELKGLLPAGVGGNGNEGGGGNGHGGSVNALAQGFVDSMQATLPASVFTVLRTASHLQAFGFNAPAAAGPAAAAAAAVAAGARAGSKRAGGGGGGGGGSGGSGGTAGSITAAAAAEAAAAAAAPLPALCRVCAAPLPSDADAAARAEAAGCVGGGGGGGGSALPMTGPVAAAAFAAQTGLCYCCHKYVLLPLARRDGCSAAEARARLEALLPPAPPVRR